MCFTVYEYTVVLLCCSQHEINYVRYNVHYVKKVAVFCSSFRLNCNEQSKLNIASTLFLCET